ncbi:hypothetical protein RRG08_003738 [Elysia crispata]|uniref:Uncharacterized protein n=1 Tax=Elysia crispata TaxID=231223 RepID=A0AAE1AVM9_9GAST|nr:hypothetical protein RRG08_003738 [Elysia crispata]
MDTLQLEFYLKDRVFGSRFHDLQFSGITCALAGADNMSTNIPDVLIFQATCDRPTPISPRNDLVLWKLSWFNTATQGHSGINKSALKYVMFKNCLLIVLVSKLKPLSLIMQDLLQNHFYPLFGAHLVKYMTCQVANRFSYPNADF